MSFVLHLRTVSVHFAQQLSRPATAVNMPQPLADYGQKCSSVLGSAKKEPGDELDLFQPFPTEPTAEERGNIMARPTNVRVYLLKKSPPRSVQSQNPPPPPASPPLPRTPLLPPSSPFSLGAHKDNFFCELSSRRRERQERSLGGLAHSREKKERGERRERKGGAGGEGGKVD